MTTQDHTGDEAAALVAGLSEAWNAMSSRVRETVFSPTGTKTLDMRYSVEQAAELIVGRSPSWLRKVIAKQPELGPDVRHNERAFYSVEGIQRVREATSALPHRAPQEQPAILAFSNFKGGVGKSTISVHFAHYMAMRGYRVLLVDCDSQASATALLGLSQVDYEAPSIATVLDGGDVSEAIYDTAWPTLKAIPSNLSLQDVEYSMTRACATASGFIETICTLRSALKEIQDRFDVIILDPPPAMGIIGLNVMAAAWGLVVPMPAKQVDFMSGVQFFRMVTNVLETLRPKIGGRFGFLRVLCSNLETNRAADQKVLGIMRRCSGDALLPTAIAHWEAVKAASVLNRTVYEMDRAPGSPTAFKNCLKNLDAVFWELEVMVRKEWPSHAQSLKRQLAQRGQVPLDSMASDDSLAEGEKAAA